MYERNIIVQEMIRHKQQSQKKHHSLQQLQKTMTDWNRCKIVRQTLDFEKKSLIFELKLSLPNGPIVVVELNYDLPLLIKIMEVGHNKPELEIASHIRSTESPTHISKDDIKFYSLWENKYIALEQTQDKDDGIKPISFYKKTITKHRVIRDKLNELNKLKGAKKETQDKMKALLGQLKQQTDKFESERNELDRRLKKLELDSAYHAIEIKRKEKALEEIRREYSPSLRRFINQLQADCESYEKKTVAQKHKMDEFVRLLPIRQAGGAN